MESTNRVNNLINRLTEDEDRRQDLWVCYLNGQPADSLDNCLKNAQLEYGDDLALRKAIWSLIKNPLSDEISDFLTKNFTDFERSIICYLYLGLELSKISEIKGISEVRIKQTMSTIRYNACWEELYGIKKTSIRSREVRLIRRRDKASNKVSKKA